MFMPRVSYNRGIFDCFSSEICLGLNVTEAYRCLCLGLKSTEAISLLRVKKNHAIVRLLRVSSNIFSLFHFRTQVSLQKQVFCAPSSSTSRVFLLSFSSNSLILASNFTFSLSQSSNFKNAVFRFSSAFLRADTLDCTNSTRFLCSAMFSSTSRWNWSARRRFDAVSDLS